MSKSSVRVLDLVTFFLDFVTFLFDLVTDLVTFPLDLVTFFLDLVTFFSPNRDDKFLRLVIIHKRDIDIFVQCTSDIIGIQRWVYLPNRSMAATVSVPSGRINRRLRRIFSQSCPLAMAEHIISSDATLKASPVKPFFSNTLSKRLPKNSLILIVLSSVHYTSPQDLSANIWYFL